MNENSNYILLVEDSEDDAVFFREALEEAGLEVRLQIARDGVEAINIIFGGKGLSGSPVKPRVIVLDLKIPKLNGLELLHKVKSDPFTRAIPVVVFSSSQEERDLLESYELGVNSFLVKPTDADDFGETVRMLGRYWLQLNQSPKT
jgi:two-component system response regulator